MVRVGFHLHNDGQETVDCSRIIYGNPGIGGAEYAIIAIAYMLSVDNFICIPCSVWPLNSQYLST